MSQQALDLRRSMQIVRRHKVLVGMVVALGMLGGAAYAVLKPPMLIEYRADRAPGFGERAASNHHRWNRSLYGNPRGCCG